MATHLTITADTSLVQEIAALAREQGAATSEPVPLALDGAMNAGVTLEDLKNGAELLTVAFKLGGSALAFLTALRAYLRDRCSATAVSIGDGQGGPPRGRLSGASSDAELQRLAGPAG